MTTLLRSMLFVPANVQRRIDKSLTLDADAIILDLEDACPTAEKVAARSLAIAALQQPRACRGYIRINATGTAFVYQDLVAVVQPGVDGIMLPKAESAEQLRMIDWLVTQLERERGLPAGAIDLLPLVETGAGISNVLAIAGACPRVRRLALGAGDLTLELGLDWTRDETELMLHRSALVVASNAAGIEPPVDMAWVRVDDAPGFAASAARSRAHGFQGKLCIHPDQLAVVNAAMAPSVDEVARAGRVVDAFRSAEQQGSAAIRVDGQLVDYPIVARALRLLSLAERISAEHKEIQ